MLIDSHCHLDRIELDVFDGQLDRALAQARARGVGGFLCIAVNADNLERVQQIASQYPDVWASTGIHPLDTHNPVAQERLRRCASHPKVVAIGETGLDYFYAEQDKALQQQSFIEHIELARSLAKPLVIHTRQARADTLALMREHRADEAGGVLHCFTEDWPMAKAALDLGFYISFSGILTFKNAAELREVASKVPLDRILVETDAPYLAPVPYRGQSNQPAYVVEVAQCLADLRQISFDTLAQQTSENFRRLFGVGLL